MQATLKTQNILYVLFIISVFFPYFYQPYLPSDVSFYALLLSVIIIIKQHSFVIKKTHLQLIITTIIVIFIFILSNDFSQDMFRSLYGYISVCLIALATASMKRKFIFTNTHIHRILNVWLIVAVLQFLIGRDFLTFMLTRSTTTPERGVTSLAVEPTYFATVIMFTLLIAVCNKLHDRIMLLKGIFMIVFLAKSSTIFVLLCIASILALVARFRVSYIKYIVFSVIITWAIINFADNRLSTLLAIGLENPTLITLDDSVNVRLLNIYFPWLLSIDNFFVPHGFGSFESVFLKSDYVNNDLISDYFYFILSDRIMSGTGKLVFEVGFLAIIYPMTLYFNLKSKKFTRYKSLLITIFFILLISTAIPLSFPLFGFLLGSTISFKTEKAPLRY